VVERYSYTAFGERTVLGGYSNTTSRIGFNHGFTGLRDESGLLFARNRYFSPELGRFISRDPAGYVDGMGLYAGYFAPNGLDPTCMMAECAEEDLGDWLDDDDLTAISYAGLANAFGELDQKASVFESARTAYRWMGYGESEAWSAALAVHEMNGFAASLEARNPVFFLSDDYEQQRGALENQARQQHMQEIVRLNRLETVNEMYGMAMTQLVPAAMMGFGGLVANPVSMMAGRLSGSAVAGAGLIGQTLASAGRVPGRSFWGGLRGVPILEPLSIRFGSNRGMIKALEGGLDVVAPRRNVLQLMATLTRGTGREVGLFRINGVRKLRLGEESTIRFPSGS